MIEISSDYPFYVTRKTKVTTICSHHSSMRYSFRFEDRELNHFLVAWRFVPVIPYFLSWKLTSICQCEYLNWGDRKLNLVNFSWRTLKSRSRWSRHLRPRSAAACLMDFRVRIPPESWLSASCECHMLSARGLCDRPITLPEVSYQMWFVFSTIGEPHTGVLAPLGLSNHETKISK
jgi:hypothetical protein